MTQVFNLLDGALAPDPKGRPGHRFSRERLTARFDSKLTGFSVYELPPGEAAWPYHYELNREEWLIVVDGELTLRTASGERPLHAGDIVCFAAGADGAHAVSNTSSGTVRFAMPSSFAPLGHVSIYPDSRKALVVGPGFRQMIKLGEDLDYWDGET